MGLLRKAAATAGLRETGGAGHSAAPPVEERPKGPGLFRRSIKALQTEIQESRPGPSPAPLAIELAGKQAEPDIIPFRIQTAERDAEPSPPGAPPPPPDRRFEDLLEQVLTGIASLRGGVELPSRLFTVLTTLLGVQKGALLLYDPLRLVYAPWAVRGYDQTTLRRMRIALGANDAWNALANGRPLFLEGTASVAPFQQYFSAREFSSVGRMILVPFIAEEKLIAVFLLTEIDSPFSTDDELSTCLAKAAEAGAPRVHEARAAQIAAGTTPGRTDARSMKDEPGQFLSTLTSAGKPVLLLSLSLEDFARTILSAHEHLDPFRLHEDLLYFLGSFLSDVGRIVSVRQSLFTVALPEFDPPALDLFTHQLGLFLHGLFSVAAGTEQPPFPRIVKSSTWPADGADLRGLVDSLSR